MSDLLNPKEALQVAAPIEDLLPKAIFDAGHAAISLVSSGAHDTLPYHDVAAEALITDIDRKAGRFFQRTVDPIKLAVAAAFEQQVWFEEAYGSLDDYAEHIAASRTITAFDAERCVGIVRLFEGTKQLPPFATEMPFYDESERSSIAELCRAGCAEELGTIAVAKDVRGGLIFENLARLAYRDAFYERGMKYWGIIMEPRRVQRMNRHYGFTFRQLGPEVAYQGGDCAAHFMDLQEVNDNMRQKFPDIYDWFVNQPLET